MFRPSLSPGSMGVESIPRRSDEATEFRTRGQEYLKYTFNFLQS
jgi:hypothetical protein